MRLFLAIPLPNNLKARLHEMQAALESDSWKVHWTAPEKLHLTLHFLGETPDNLLSDLHHDLSALAHARRPFDVTCEGLGAFPNWDEPRVLWAGVKDQAGKLGELAEASVKVLRRYRLFKLREEFVPHLTLGRVDTLKPSWDVNRLKAVELGKLGVLPVERMILFKSESGKYLELENFKFSD